MINFKAKLFFDRKAVIDRVGAAKAKVLGRIGAFIKRRAQTSMPYRKEGKASAPGKPPFAHKGGRGPLLRKFLFSVYDPGKDTVVVGPERMLKGEAPPLEEYGGQVKRTKVIESGRKAHTPLQAKAFRAKVLSGQIKPKKKPTKVYTAKYPARPFMATALAKEVTKIPDRWKNSIKK